MESVSTCPQVTTVYSNALVLLLYGFWLAGGQAAGRVVFGCGRHQYYHNLPPFDPIPAPFGLSPVVDEVGVEEVLLGSICSHAVDSTAGFGSQAWRRP